jgi:(E)-4-hydroxy-3-methylbut-2-enyl-diphosphate synthase
VPQEQLVDALFEEIDKYTKTKRIDVDAREQAEGAQWLERIEEENAGELTPERLAKLEAEAQRAEAEAMAREGIDVIPPADRVALDEDASPTAGRRFTRA